MDKTLIIRSALIGTGFAVVSTLSHAQLSTVSLGDKPDSGIEYRIGALGLHSPRYPGADESRWRVWPSFAAYSSTGWFVTVANGVGWNFGNGKTIDYGVRLTYDLGRDENDTPRLKGMGDIKPRLEAGGFFNYDLTRNLTVKTSLRYGSGRDSDGMLFDTALNFGFPIIEGTFGVVGLSTTYANESYMRSYFGVTPVQSALSGYAVYTPGASFRDAAVNVSMFSNFTKEWSGFAKLGFTRLEGDARASPITLKPNYTTLMMGASYKF